MVSLLIPALLLQVPIRVACLGDSITFGYGLPEATRLANNYPGKLGQRLGGGYIVKGFGHTGCTLMNSTWLPPMIKTDEYKAALAFKPNLVIIMGGTNDGAPQNWAHISQLPGDLKVITHSFLTQSAHPTVMIMLPPRMCTKAEGGMFSDEHCQNVNQGLPQIFRDFARANALQLIDSRLSITSRDCYTPDGVHLTEKGHAKLANQVAAVVLKKQNLRK